MADAEKRTKLAFACSLTAVGIPQILAGDEFADQHVLLRGHAAGVDPGVWHLWNFVGQYRDLARTAWSQ